MPETGEWSDKNLPTKMDLIDYIKKELYKDGDLLTHGFLDEYFEPMLADGRFYFIFDSFDEMPCLMGGANNSVLIKRISELIHEFLTGPNQNGGIIASRMYNRPSEYLDQSYTLRLQRFDNARIRKMLKRYLANRGVNDTIIKLFKDRLDLLELCRNPFHLSLLIDYIRRHKQGLPNNQFELFKDFIETRLEKSSSRSIEKGFIKKDIYEAAIELAVMMQKDKNYGLDYPIDRLYLSCNRFSKEQWENCIILLTYAKICRTGGNNQTVSFVHRRFQEFFFVESLIKGNEKITEKDLLGILDNTGIRDALVLYCQIGEEKKIQEIIDYCCLAIKDNENCISGVLNNESIKLVNALYFLIESLSNRKAVLCNNNNIKVISELKRHLKKKTHYVVLMSIVNSISLLDSNEIQLMLLDVFSIQNRWLNSVLFSKCQLIQKLNRRTEIGFILYFEYTGFLPMVRKYFTDDFSLSLTKCFNYVRRIHTVLPFVVLSKTALYLCAVMSTLPFSRNLFWYSVDYINKTNSVNIETLVNDIRSMHEIQPMSGARMILYAVGLLLLIFAHLVMFSNFAMLISNFHIDFESKLLEKINMKKSMIAMEIDSARKIFKHKEKNESEDSEPLLITALAGAEPILLVYFIYFLKDYFPDGLLLYILIILELFLLVYYTYRAVHEIIIPLVKSKDSLKNLKGLPAFIFRSIISSIITAVCMLLVVAILFFAIPAGICYIIGIENPIDYVVIFIVKVIICLIIVILLSAFILLCRDRLFLLFFTKIEKIERKELLSIINKRLAYNSARRRYIKILMDNEVELYGEWPDNYSTLIQDDMIIRSLAMWDCKALGIENTFVE